MTPRERMMIALDNGRPDRLPCQVHNWMDFYLKTYLDGDDVYQAYERFGMDMAVYTGPNYIYDDKDLADWQVDRRELDDDGFGNQSWVETITTPKGTLTSAGAYNDITGWLTEEPIKTLDDFEIWNQFLPEPVAVDFSPIQHARDKVGDRGIVRSFPFSPGQGSPWQSFCTMIGTEPAIMMAMDEPDQLHYILEQIVQKTLRVVEKSQGNPADLIETDGGAGSNTVISPAMFEQFCLPYDKRQVDAYHELGMKTVCHLCGGVMQMLELVVQTGADGMETMTPVSMGGDCDLAEASRRVGERLFFVGGFDQNAGFEHGTPDAVRQMVFECFEATRDHAGYIISPSDHFFHGDPANIQAFVDAARECRY